MQRERIVVSQSGKHSLRRQARKAARGVVRGTDTNLERITKRLSSVVEKPERLGVMAHLFNNHASSGRPGGRGAVGHWLDQPMATLDGPFGFRDVPGISIPCTSTAGVLLLPITIDPDSNVSGIPFWVDIADAWEEYRIVSAYLETGPIKAGSTNTGEGFTAIYIDELNPTTNPVAADAYSHSARWVSNSNNGVDSEKRLRAQWYATDLSDADWVSTVSTTPVASFKMVASPATTGTNSGTTSDMHIAQVFYTFEVRQFRS